MAFGESIRELRKARGKSLGWLSGETGVSRGYLSQIETGAVRSPSVHLAARIARSLGVSVERLVTGIEADASVAAMESELAGHRDWIMGLMAYLRRNPVPVSKGPWNDVEAREAKDGEANG